MSSTITWYFRKGKERINEASLITTATEKLQLKTMVFFFLYPSFIINEYICDFTELNKFLGDAKSECLKMCFCFRK